MAYPQECVFCKIADAYPASKELVPSDPPVEFGSQDRCFLLLNTELVMAFLDIQPLGPGHVLLIPRSHREKATDLRMCDSVAVGAWMPVVTRAVIRVCGREGWNVYQNNGPSAGQVVPHFHYHIVPHIKGKDGPLIRTSWAARHDLDDDEAIQLARDIRAQLTKDLAAMEKENSDARTLLGKL